MKKVFFLTLIILIIGGIFFAWEIYLPKNSLSQEEVIFRIEKGEGSKDIALNLERDGLIKWDLPFRVYVLTKGISGNLQAGTYELSSSMTISRIAQKFTSGDTLEIKVTIPEGFTLKDIQEELTSKLRRTVLRNFRVKDFKEKFDFLADSPDVASLEGFLFPDTYFFEPDEGDEDKSSSSPSFLLRKNSVDDKGIVERFLRNFEEKFTPYQNRAALAGKKIFEIITMASLLEKEVNAIDDKKVVSGILWKRLENKVPLQVDATISYITGKRTTRISIEETKIDSPYNTYKYLGLPIGPISNPGLESILAAISPQKSDFWYYLSTPDGETIFSKTLEEHNQARAKYLK